jgi:hypothetical protein
MHPGSCHIYLKARGMKKVESDANVRMSYFQIHHLKQSAREQLMTPSVWLIFRFVT